MNHKGTKNIKTERLLLRPFTPDDAEAMFANWACDSRVTRFLTWVPHESASATRELLERWCADYEKDDNYNWAITVDGNVIGSICVVRQSERDEYAELGYCLSADFWNGGIMTEAAYAVTRYLFEEIGFNRIGISHATANPASGRVAQKCGYTYEGTKREYFKTNFGEFLDIAEYSILKSEWDAHF